MGLTCRRLPHSTTLALSLLFACLLSLAALPRPAFAVDPASFVDSVPAGDESLADDGIVSGYIPDVLPAPSVHDGDEGGLRVSANLPERYDSRELGLVTPVKDQGSFPTCWAFATMGVLESSLLCQGTVQGMPDLSERHLSYFLYHTAPDPLGNTAGDSTVAVTEDDVEDPSGYLRRGGNATMACYALESWMGVAREDAPGVGTYADLMTAYYDADYIMTGEFLSQVALDESLSHSVDSYHLTQVRRIPFSDVGDVKQAILDNGAVFLSLYFGMSYLNEGTGAYFRKSAAANNHAVVIVGWDDDFPRSSFLGTRTKPTSDGAWICKNSYGSGQAYSYFYLSYEDQAVLPRASDGYDPVVFTLEAEPTEALDNNYQYDGTVVACYNLIESGGSLANVFVARANEGGYERLQAVSFNVSSADVAYSVQVYVNPTDASDPTSGTATLAEPITGTTSYAGYYTVDLGAGVALSEGDVFAVVVTLACDDEYVFYDVDCTYGTNGRYDETHKPYHCIAHVEPGQSFERETADAGWDDLSLDVYDEYGDDIEDEPACCARIKAFTVNESLSGGPWPGDVLLPESAGTSIDIGQAQVDGIAPQIYTGEELTPAVRVVYANEVLREGRDYQVSYADNVEEGDASVTIAGCGRFSNSRLATFAIYVPVYDLEEAQLDPIAAQRYTGTALTPEVTLTYQGTVLRRDVDYEVNYADNVEVGSAHVTVSGIDPYVNSRSAPFEIYAEPLWERLWGNSSLDTMRAIVQTDGVFDATTVDTVVVASADGFKDALAAAGLAGRLGAPVLITPGAKLASQTASELERLNPATVVVASGPAAVSDEVLAQIRQVVPAAEVQRVCGNTAVDTALEFWRAGDGWGDTAIVVTSDSYKDALSIAPFAYAKGAPIFLAKPSSLPERRVLSDGVKGALVEGGFSRVVIVGGTLSVAGGDTGVEGQVEELARSCGRAIEVVRLSGANAVDTSRLVAAFELGEGMGLAHMAVATTASYKDALCGAPLAGAQNSVLVLAGTTGGYEAFDAVFDRNRVAHGHVLGGSAAISDASWNHITSNG